MKKFLCYDTNDAASGKINVDSRGMLKPNSTVPSGSTPYQQLVTDGEGNTKWEDRLAYDDSRVVVKMFEDDNASHYCVKVSDEIPSWAKSGTEINVSLSTGESSVETLQEAIADVLVSENITVVFKPIDFHGIVFPEKGIYFYYGKNKADDSVTYVSGVSSSTSDTPEITWDGNIGGIKKIDEKFIPDTRFFVNISTDDSDNLVADKTYQEIVDAYVNGIQVVAVHGPATFYLSYCPAEISTFEEVPHLSFFTTFTGGANIIIAVLQMDNKGNISLIEKSIS